MTVKDLIEELKNYPPETPVFIDGFDTPLLDMATIADFDVKRAKKTGMLYLDKSTERRVLTIISGGDEREQIDVNGYKNGNPHFITNDYDDIQRT